MKKLTYFLVTIQLFCLSFLSAEEAEAPPARDGGFTQTLIMLALAMLFFYFILWRPEQKRRKEQEEQRSSIKPGDRVMAMGIIGTVVKVQDLTVILKMYDGSKIEVVKGAITETLPPAGEESKKAE